MSRKRTHRKYRAPGLHPLDVIQASRPMPAHQVADIILRIHDAFAHLRGGGKDEDLFNRMCMVMNVGMVRSEEIGQAGVELFKDAQRALMNAARICEVHGHYGLTGPGLETVREAVALYEEILAASSPLQMARAQDECIRRMRKGDVYGLETIAVESHAA